MNNKTTKAWRQYEAGCDYKRRIGLYETVRENERFLRGDQWRGSGGDLPRPVFNILRRIIDYMVCTVFSKKAAISFTDDDLPYTDDEATLDAMRRGIELLGRHASFRWERCKMDKILRRALYDAAISGDGAVYCYFDPDAHSIQPFKGDIVTENVDNVNLFVADVNKADIQSQEYIILAGRQSVLSLRREAVKYGMSHADADRLICSDDDTYNGAGDMAAMELGGDDDERKATYLIKFWREGGRVCFEKSLKNCVIRRVKTDCRLYPVAYMNWYSTKNSFHGTSPITGLIPNQKFINRGYAMVMKHMADTAFSKVIYDKTRIPEWTNEVGEAIAAVGATNVSDAVSVIEPGKLEEGYMELLNDSIAMTKEMMGATEAALGNLNPTNTSAILAIQEASKVPLLQIKDNVSGFAEDIANIWADMMCTYYPPERLVPFFEGSEVTAASADFSLLRDTMVQAHVEISDPERFSVAYNQAVLDRLLDGGHITFTEYLERLPSGIVIDRDALIAKRRLMEIEKEKNYGREENAA
ncbi:MAG: hypothetical protein IJZ89_03910 [Clostridia bacterium]|nr:hypothetical protein [Clostridia bacterium]